MIDGREIVGTISGCGKGVGVRREGTKGENGVRENRRRGVREKQRNGETEKRREAERE